MRSVTLYEDTWFGHILVRHPELSGKLDMVEAAVSAPTAIYASTSIAGSFLFVRNDMIDSTGRFLRVVGRANREVRTVYFTSASGGRQIWPQRKMLAQVVWMSISTARRMSFISV
jgi:hypothetical protein